MPPEPSYFVKPPTTLNGHRRPIRMAKGARFLNYEGELAVVVGRRMKGVPVDDALSYVAGYTCANDVGMHDFRHADRGAMLRVKGQDGFLPLGPELVPAAEFDPTDYTLRTYLNGDVVQEATAGDLMFGVAYQLADLCRVITLEPGDVILTGTPANSRPMKPGDVVEVEITGLGRLTNTIEEWDVDLAGPGEQLQVSAQTLHVALAIPEDEAERMVAEGRARRDPPRPDRPRRPAASGPRRGGRPVVHPARARRAAARGAARLPRLQRRAVLPRARRSGRSRGTTTPRSSSTRPARPTTRARTSRRSASASRSGRGRSGSPTRTAARSSCSRTARPRRRSTAGRSTRDPSATVHVGGPRRLGHVNCLTGDIDANAAFYTDVLGMRLSDWLGTAGVWFHIDSEHHVMALVDLGYAHFHHLAFDVVDIGKMRDLLDHLARHGRWVSWGPTRHGIAREHRHLRPHRRGAVPRRALLRHGAARRRPRAAHLPDDRYSSNTWGPLPPRSYFRFDPVAIECESESWETRGRAAASGGGRGVTLKGYSARARPRGARRSSRIRRGTTSARSS